MIEGGADSPARTAAQRAQAHGPARQQAADLGVLHHFHAGQHQAYSDGSVQ
jgi:hypothetical protein